MTVQDSVDQGTGWSGLLEVVPLPALHVAAGEMVTAINGAWETLSGLDEHASVGTGWTQVVVDPDRLRKELAGALVSGTSGSSDHQLWLDGAASCCRWWWRPAVDQELVVGVASIEADKTPEHRLSYRAISDPLAVGGSDRSAAADHDDELAGWLVNRIFAVTLDLHVAATTPGEHTCGLVDEVVENLDRLVVDLRLAVFDQRYGDQIRRRSR